MRLNHFLRVAGAFTSALLFAQMAAASDFCDKPRNATERTVCEHDFLLDLDRRLNNAYQQFGAHFHGAALENLREEQRTWIRARDACGAKVECIRLTYEDRITALGGDDASSGGQGIDCPEGYEFTNGRCLQNDELTGDPCGPGFEQVPETDNCISTSIGQDNRQLPMKGRSYGGIVRKQPSMESRRVTSLSEGERVRIIRNTGDQMGQYFWYEIRYDGNRAGYQWGGILCSDRQLEGILARCK